MKYGKALISRGGSTTRRPAIPAAIFANLARQSEDQIGLSDGKDRRHKEWKTKQTCRFAPSCARGRSTKCLLTSQRFDQSVGKCRYCLKVRRRLRIR